MFYPESEPKRRPLEISDLATAQEEEIRKNPFQFLGMAEDASFADARRAFIGLSRIYHPDLINPKTVSTVQRNYTPEDYIAAGFDEEEILATIAELTNPSEETISISKKREQALENIRALAHQKMVLINRAYEEIKRRFGPEGKTSFAGYDHWRKYAETEGAFYNEVRLEGRGEVNIYTSPFEYWVAGPYLSFDWGPPVDHEWYPEENWRQEITLKHLFAHIALAQGYRPGRVLLQPLAECFGLDEQKIETLIGLLMKEGPSGEIFKVLKINELPKDQRLRETRFCRQINEIYCLDRSYSRDYPVDPECRIYMEITDDGKLILKDWTESIFSETDFNLFATLAYGPLLT